MSIVKNIIEKFARVKEIERAENYEAVIQGYRMEWEKMWIAVSDTIYT